MSKNRRTIEVIPPARRMIRSLRDIGYDFKHALADIVDNSISANATLVSIEMRFDGEESWVRVADNGSGMSGETITEAMRFGTEREYETNELGKFGLGLKTASLSQCYRFSVASRVDTAKRLIEVRQWDIDHVEATNKWEIINIPMTESPVHLTEPLQKMNGTTVLWEQLDRILGYKVPWGDRARSGFFRLAEELDLHLGMVFHRFLSGESKRRDKLKITINGTNVEAWDPFARSETATVALDEQQFEIESGDGSGVVTYRPFILPSRERFSSLRAFDRHAGPGKWNYQQGFYIYRADRMIQNGGWSYMRTSDEHTKLARVALDFSPDLDSAFDLNVAKARVNLPTSLKQQLKPNIEQLVKLARKAYMSSSRYGTETTNPGVISDGGISSSGGSVPAGIPNPDANTQSLFDDQQNNSGQARPALYINDSIGKSIEHAASKIGETQALWRIRKALREQNPETAIRIGW